MPVDSSHLVVAPAEHPSLAGDVAVFLDELRAEPRYFGPRAAANPKPFPSLIEALAQPAGLRQAAVECGRIVGLARVDDGGELFLAVVADRRRDGIGVALCRAAVRRAADAGHTTVVMRSTQRSRAAHRMARHLDGIVVDHRLGRRDLLLRSG